MNFKTIVQSSSSSSSSSSNRQLLNLENKGEMAIATRIEQLNVKVILCVSVLLLLSGTEATQIPMPKPWPHQFHSILMMNYSGELQIIDLWYDWINGRNFNIIRHQLDDDLLYDLEWNNGTSFFYTLPDASSPSCRSSQLEVGILRPNWLDGANYIGQRNVDGFLCNVWEKADFITYYEDVITQRPVHWLFYTGRAAHVMTFEVGAALEDAKWQAPAYCFGKKDHKKDLLADYTTKPTSPYRSLRELHRKSLLTF